MSAGVKIMTSDDIYFEVKGKRIAGVESYSTKYTNDVKTIDAFGQSAPIGYTIGGKKYTVDISRVYLEDTAIKDGIDFYNLADFGFNFVVVKGKVKTVYKDCIISDISEDGSLKDKVAEKITLMALSRSVE
jgi:hypothetical protein